MTSIQITHQQKNIWLDSNLLEFPIDSIGNILPMCGKKQSMESEIIKFAKQQAMDDDSSLTFDTAQNSDKYRFVIGAMFEVLVEFYLKMFEQNNFDLRLITDTSADIFCRGFDFVGKAGVNNEFDVQIQVKWRNDPKHKFTRNELYTMIDEAEKAGIVSKNLYLIVPSAVVIKEFDILSYKEEFQKEWTPKITVITGKMMQDKINFGLIKMYPNPLKQFWISFKECLETEK